MPVYVADPRIEERLIAERQKLGHDRYDEVWEGVYMMAPAPNLEHQQIVAELTAILQNAVGWAELGNVYPGANVTDQTDHWESDYRVPDIVVRLRGGLAEGCGSHLRGAVDFLVEVASPGDRVREKIPFYSRLGVRELLLVDRDPWTLGLYRYTEGKLQETGRSTPNAPSVLASDVVPLSFRLVPGEKRPQIEVTRPDTGQSWMV